MMIDKEKRLLDANLNRLKEGIRVIEDIFRYIFDNSEVALRLKNLRHLAKLPNYNELLTSRDIKNDVLKQTTKSEATRKDINDILIANFKRAQESARVLEEFCKLTNSENADTFKSIRYELYDIEKSISK